MRFLPLFLTITFSLIAHFEYDPHVFVSEHVNALTGDFVASEVDLVVDAIQPIVIRRTYESSDGKWRIIPQKELILHGKKGGKGVMIYTSASVYEPNGSCLTYLIKEGHFKLEYPDGFANTSRGNIGGRTHLINQSVEQIDPSTIRVTTPEKTVRIYKKGYQDNRNLVYLLESEELPNGNFFLYSYDPFMRLETIKSVNPTKNRIYAECTFVYLSTPKKGCNFDIETSDNQKQSYRYTLQKKSKKNGSLYTLTKVGNQTFSYNSQNYSLTKYGEIPISYDSEGRVDAFDGIKFQYVCDQTFVDGMIYRFNEKKQLIQCGNHFFRWSTNGDLLETESTSYLYDLFGNVILKNETAMAYDTENRLIKKVEDDSVTTYSYLGKTDLITEETLGTDEKVWLRTQYTYNQDHLLLRKSIDDGPQFTFQKTLELKGPPQKPTAIIEKGGDIIIGNHNFQYCGNTVIANGNHPKELNYSPSTSLLYQFEITEGIGEFEEEIIDGAYIERDFFNRITLMEVKDDDGNLLTSKKWEYSTFFLTSETDPEGVITRYFYDEAGRKVKQVIETEMGDQETFYTYDNKGRLDKMICGEVVTCYQYDEDDQIIDEWEEDLQGNILLKSPTSIDQRIPPFPAHEGAHKRYDLLGRLIELYTDDGTVHYTITYNKRKEPITITDQVSGATAHRSYNALGNLVSESLLNGETLFSDYDIWGRRTEFTLPDNSKIYYRWGPKFLDEITRITTKQNFEYRHRFISYNSFGFPKVQRLIEGFGQCTYDCDSSGKVIGIHTRHFEQTAPKPDPFSYEITPIHYTTITDGLGRITTFLLDDQKITFTYDIWNRRMSKTIYFLVENEWVISAEYHYLYDDQTDIGTMRRYEDTFQLTQLRVLANHPINTGDQSIAYEFDQMPYVPLFDLNGNPSILLSVIRRKVMESYEYTTDGHEKITDYWGDRLTNSKAGNPWRYRCQRYDEDLGLYYSEGRYFNP